MCNLYMVKVQSGITIFIVLRYKRWEEWDLSKGHGTAVLCEKIKCCYIVSVGNVDTDYKAWLHTVVIRDN